MTRTNPFTSRFFPHRVILNLTEIPKGVRSDFLSTLIEFCNTFEPGTWHFSESESNFKSLDYYSVAVRFKLKRDAMHLKLKSGAWTTYEISYLE